MDPSQAQRVVIRPYVTEKIYNLIEKENKLIFLVREDASKPVIKDSVETLYRVKVHSINTARTISGKKAYVRLLEEGAASELASRLGLV